ncbi:MAG: hypothetical protein OES24_19635 [Acidimicrobiia bacterium]|nr:hypothetical protein [Acidimicrobiia bacterium]
MSKREWTLTTLVGLWLVLFCLLSFHLTIVLWGPAIEFSRYQGSQEEQLDEVREVLTDVGEQADDFNEASRTIEEAQASIAAGDEAAADVALDEVQQAVEGAEDAVSNVADQVVDAGVAAAESALQDAQDDLDAVATDGSTATEEAMDAIEAAEDAVEEAEGAVGEAAVGEARTILRKPPELTVRILWLFDWRATEEVLLLGLALAGAGVGISAGALSAITRLVGVREFEASWLSWHAARPLWGLAAAAISYAAIRGGLLNINNSAAALNPFAVFAIGAVFGLNSSDGLKMLKGILKPSPRPELVADHETDTETEAGTDDDKDASPATPEGTDTGTGSGPEPTPEIATADAGTTRG